MLSACGIEERWSNPTHPMTFTGTIKDTPADFVVVEVDLHQQRVDTEGYVFYDEHKNNNPNNNVNHSNKKEEKQEEKGLSEKEVFLLFQQHYEPILQFFGSSSVVGEKAEELFLSKDKNNVDPFLEYLSRGGFSQNNNNNNNETENYWEREYRIENVSFNKENRKLFHHLVSQSFLHIRSRVRYGDDNNNNENDMFLIVNPHFFLFVLLFNVTTAEKLSYFYQYDQKINKIKKEYSSELVSMIDTFLLTSAQNNNSNNTDTKNSDMDDLMGAFLSPGEKSNKTSNNNFLSLEPIRVHFREAYHSNVSLRDLKKLFHEIMRKYYHNCIKSSVKDGVVYLSLFENHNSNNNKKRKREEEENETTNPQAAKLYVYCILQKYNLETTEMKNLLGDYFSNHNTNHTIANTICIAGLKDKKAITYQRASIPFQVSPLLKTLQEQQPSSLLKENETGLLQLNGSDDGWVRLVRISTAQNSVDSGLFPSPINIGDLSGNHFTIKVKHIAPSQPSEIWGSVLQERFQQTCERGLINYFGQQRFSEEADDVLTSHVGLCLVKGQYCEAVESLFKSPSQQQHKVDLQDLYWNKFPSEMHPKHIPARLKDVLAITKALRQTYKMQYGNQNTLTNADVQGRTPRWRSLCEAALRDGVPYALRTMWVHAAQSLYFNMTASALVRRLQAQPLPEEEAHALLLPLGGYQTNTERHPLVTAACLEAQTSLELTTEQLYTQRKVCGVPFSGGERALLVRPREARLTVTEERGEAVLAFYLPSSSYATVLLREVLGTDQWW